MEKSGKLLIVDDNTSILNSLELFLKHKFQKVVAITNPNKIIPSLENDDFDVVLLDMNFSASQKTGNEGLYWMRKIKNLNPNISIIPITAFGEVENAVQTMKEGAVDYILKPWDNDKLLATIHSACLLKKSKDEISRLKEKQDFMTMDRRQRYSKLLWKDNSMKAIYETIQKVAKTDANILIIGENGTGKEIVAYEIHKLSKQKNEIFVRVDLGALSESLFESEMFGHKKGAFTDAKTGRIGKMQTASDGTLMLDEISNLSLTLQAKLLSALQSKTIVPVGGNKSVSTNFRLICASNKNLEEMVANKLFREDLLYRINTILIEIPPLRKRPEDIEYLANHFLKIFADKYEKYGLRMDASAIQKLKEFNWPGNVRELKHTVEKAVILSDTKILAPENFALKIADFHQELSFQNISLEAGEKLIIQKALENNHRNITDTAKELKIGRQTLYRKIEKYKL